MSNSCYIRQGKRQNIVERSERNLRQKTQTLLDTEPLSYHLHFTLPQSNIVSPVQYQSERCCPHETPTTRGCYMILYYISYIIAPNNGKKSMINAERVCHHDLNHVPSHICHMLQRSYVTKGKIVAIGKLDQTITEMICHHEFMYHFPSLTCCKDHKKVGRRGGGSQ